MITTDVTIRIGPFEKPFPGVAPITVVVERAVWRGAPCFHRVILGTYEQVVSKVPVLPNRGWSEPLAGATDGVVVAQDPGWIIVQLEVEAGDAVSLIAYQIDGSSIERLSRQGRVRVVAAISVYAYVMATIVRLDRIILGP